jgi:hypothetical protein
VQLLEPSRLEVANLFLLTVLGASAFDWRMNRTASELFIAQVEGFLKRTGIKPSEFGQQAVGDRAFITNLRRGRSPTLATVDRVLAFMGELDAAAARPRAYPPDRNR